MGTADTDEEREQDYLTRLLKRVDDRLGVLRPEVFTLEQRAEGLRRALATFDQEPVQEHNRDAAVTVELAPATATATGHGEISTPRKRLGLAKFLRNLMADGQRRHLTDVLAVLEATEPFASNMPTRNSVSNRLFDLEKSGYLRRIERGTYQLASTSDTAPSNGAGGAGADETEPRQANQLAQGEGLGSTPPGGFS